VRQLALTPPTRLAERARASAGLVRRRYRLEHYAAGVRAALRDVLATRGLLPAGVSPPPTPTVRWEMP
jgi:hypothetical protein